MDSCVPKILHQVWISTEDVPEQWRHCCEKYKELCAQNGWEYRLWTTVSSRKLIETEYSWFLQQYDAYEYVIQRADSIRYFILHKYGGIYSDLDIKPKENFFSLYEMYKNSDVALPSNKERFNNGFMISKPESPFWPIVWKHLQNPGKTTWYKPILAKTHYYKILYTTGAGMISDAAKEYSNIAAIPFELIQPKNKSTPESVVELYEGGESWQQKDASVWKAVDDVTNNTQWILLGFVIAFSLVIVVLLVKIKNMRDQGNQNDHQSDPSPRKKSRRKANWD